MLALISMLVIMCNLTIYYPTLINQYLYKASLKVKSDPFYYNTLYILSDNNKVYKSKNGI